MGRPGPPNISEFKQKRYFQRGSLFWCCVRPNLIDYVKIEFISLEPARVGNEARCAGKWVVSDSRVFGSLRVHWLDPSSGSKVGKSFQSNKRQSLQLFKT